MHETAITLCYCNRAGTLDRIIGLLRRRGFPIGGMTVERTHRADVNRMTITVERDEVVPQMCRHLERIPDVLEVGRADGTLCREYALARISCGPAQRSEVMTILSAYHAHPLAIGADHLVIEVTGFRDHLDALFAALTAYGVDDVARTYPMALRLGEPADDTAACQERQTA